MAGKSLIYKILESHLVEGRLVAGEDIAKAESYTQRL